MKRFFLLLRAACINAPMFLSFKMKQVSNGKHVRTHNGWPKLAIDKGGTLIIGDSVNIQNHLNTGWYASTMLVVKRGGRLQIGSYTGLNSCMIYCSKSITIGEHVAIGGGTRIFDTNFHDVDYLLRRDGNTGPSSPVVIGDDVFIGTGCIIGKGVTIGDRSVIAAGSVVVKDIPSNCIAGGNPCKVIKQY